MTDSKEKSRVSRKNKSFFVVKTESHEGLLYKGNKMESITLIDKVTKKPEKKRIWMANKRADVFQDRREKRERTRSAQFRKALKEYNYGC